MMLLKKIRHLSDYIKNFSKENEELKDRLVSLEKKVDYQDKEISYLKDVNKILENNNNIIIQDLSLLAISVTEIYNYLADSQDDIVSVKSKKKITYH